MLGGTFVLMRKSTQHSMRLSRAIPDSQTRVPCEAGHVISSDGRMHMQRWTGPDSVSVEGICKATGEAQVGRPFERRT